MGILRKHYIRALSGEKHRPGLSLALSAFKSMRAETLTKGVFSIFLLFWLHMEKPFSADASSLQHPGSVEFCNEVETFVHIFAELMLRRVTSTAPFHVEAGKKRNCKLVTYLLYSQEPHHAKVESILQSSPTAFKWKANGAF